VSATAIPSSDANSIKKWREKSARHRRNSPRLIHIRRALLAPLLVAAFAMFAC
jgi:hypothetical protein